MIVVLNHGRRTDENYQKLQEDVAAEILENFGFPTEVVFVGKFTGYKMIAVRGW